MPLAAIDWAAFSMRTCQSFPLSAVAWSFRSTFRFCE
jgi:hypothetical protein